MKTAPSAQPSEQQQPSASVARGRTCVSCGQTDTLNSQFCIFCGARVEGPVAGNGTPGTMASAVDALPVPRGSQASALGLGILGCVVAGLIGASLGGGLAYMKSQKVMPQASVKLPESGLTILTTAPNAVFEVESEDHKRFLVGKTGPDGDVNIEELRPDQYHVTVTSPGGEVWEKDVAVNSSTPVTLGAAPDEELFNWEKNKQ